MAALLLNTYTKTETGQVVWTVYWPNCNNRTRHWMFFRNT